MVDALREFVIGLAVELPARCLFSHAAPLFEKEWHAFAFALIPHRDDPFLLHRPCSVAALSTNDYPIDSFEIEFAQIFQERLDREKTDPRFGSLQIFNARKAVLPILD